MKLNQSADVAPSQMISRNNPTHMTSNNSVIKLQSRREIAKQLQKQNKRLPKQFKLAPIDLEDMSNSKTLALEEWNHASPSPDFMIEKKKRQRRMEYWDSKIRDDCLPKLNVSHEYQKRRPRFKL